MRYLVTGGCGFIGSNLVDKLVEQGHDVIILDNLLSGNRENLRKSVPHPKVKFYQVDIRSDLSSLNLQADVIFHLAAQSRIQPSFDNPLETSDINIIGTVKILELARKIGAKVVYAGSSSFYGGPRENPYSLSKWLGEEQCAMYNLVFGVPVAIARFFNVYGPRNPGTGGNAAVIAIFERQRKNNEALTVTGCGNQRRDFVHVSDIADGLIAMSHDKWNGEIFNLGNGLNFSMNEVANMFNSKEIIHIPARPGEAWETLADIFFTTEKLGWLPKCNLQDYVNQFLKTI